MALRAVPDVRFAGGVLVEPGSPEPVLYTENLFVKFIDTADPDNCLEVLREAGLSIKQTVEYATNAYFVSAPEGTGQKVFEIAQKLLARDDVEYCHPEIIRRRASKAIAPQQWHLAKTTLAGVAIDAHANVAAAHEISQGEGITIAVIDDGVDIDHVEFAGPGKQVAPRDATDLTDDPRPQDTFGTGPENGDNHGTACAGVACANGAAGASGVAPKARLMPIRLASGLGSQREGDAFKWAADHGADVISCSWGPPDGDWWDLSDARHNHKVPLPANTRLALDYVTTQGRGGKGCVVLFAAGNGNESVDNDGYASAEKVIAVAACNDRGKRSVYSDFGKAVWCAFPSNDFGHAPFSQQQPLTTGIWTTDRQGSAGYNTGKLADGDAAGTFTNSFGGTSSACPGAAGVAALVFSVNPALNWRDVKDLLRRACDRIDPGDGAYDPQGHSDKYGHGRLNARTAVELARPAPRSELVVSRRFDAPIPDLQTVSFALDVLDATPVASLTVSIDLTHSFIGDLVLTLKAPAGSGMADVVLHKRQGGSAKSIRRAFDAASAPNLARAAGKSCRGTWTLTIADAAAQDAGTLISFGLTFAFPPPVRAVGGQGAVGPAVKAVKPAGTVKAVKPVRTGKGAKGQPRGTRRRVAETA
ncbi:S8 family serine peptidase [Variovorax sp. J22R24]|uniref:S8 family serine peptidase n=1 Tax=Variovorax gracilis TaxID=3053502 RepID=UPI002575287A|nr:S8 family serine peptidase [Variovorax sp. J22R24]MDM0109275.1 S8 family serine peptidase [Variovorax sp. J22R24]